MLNIKGDFYMAKKEPYILVPGGAGYIGSHTVKLLINRGHNVLVLDNLSTGHVGAVDEKAKLIVGDVNNLHLLQKIFKKYNIVGVMNFAGKIIVPESVHNPITYFEENVNSVASLLRAMKQFNCQNFVFSSSASVYGTSDVEKITEDAPTHPESPYAFSKYSAENLIRFCERPYGIRHVIFRYFNVAGSYDTCEIGEAHPQETHLIPTTVINAINDTQMTIFGNDYNTPDKTCVRDYIHIMDLAEAHVKGMEYLLNGGSSQTINLGSENGYSNLQIVQTAQEVLKKQINFVFGPRREGDPAKIVASSAKAKEILNWEPTRHLETMIRSDFTWRQTHPKLYNDFEEKKVSQQDLQKVLKVRGAKNITKMYEEVELKQQEHLKDLYKQNKKFCGNKILSK